MNSITRDTIVASGQTAAATGLTLDQNPYSEPEARKAWEEGFRSPGLDVTDWLEEAYRRDGELSSAS